MPPPRSLRFRCVTTRQKHFLTGYNTFYSLTRVPDSHPMLYIDLPTFNVISLAKSVSNCLVVEGLYCKTEMFSYSITGDFWRIVPPGLHISHNAAGKKSLPYMPLIFILPL